MSYSIYTTYPTITTGPTYTVGNTGSTGIGGAVGAAIGTNGTALNWNSVSTNSNLQGSTLQVKGNADISGELTVQGVNLTKRLDKIEERLGILRPNEQLEAKWENLRALGNAYRELEKEIIEKQEMWAILKK